jgi:hypothetical protein
MAGPWVVYAIPRQGCRAVCTQAEWARMTATKPDLYTFVRGGITHEGEAERMARGTAGDNRPALNPAAKPPVTFEPWYQTLSTYPIAPLG